jgi:membrane peptidoglycan carboxypeptidase
MKTHQPASTSKTRDSGEETLAYHNSVNMFRLKQSLLGVVEKGTARSISKWTGVIAGKTGTVEVCKGGCKNTDAWFVGFNKEITVAVWVGYPENENLGQGNHGSVVALPIFKDFMEEYYKAYPEKEKEPLLSSTPQGMSAVKVEGTTGFVVDNEFIKDFSYYTGRDQSYFETLTSEVYATDAERDSMSSYRRNKASMALFYEHFTANRKQDIQSDFRQKYATQPDNSAYDQYQYLYNLCSPWLYTNEQGDLTWDPSFNVYSRRPTQREGQQIHEACLYVARNPEPQRVSGTSGNATNSQLKEFFINNY